MMRGRSDALNTPKSRKTCQPVMGRDSGTDLETKAIPITS
jgi:hypothetical protein